MENVIFLTNQQKTLLEEAGISMSTVTHRKLSEVLTLMDYRVVLENTQRLMSGNNLLARMGYKYSENTNGAAAAYECDKSLIPYDLDKSVFNGICSNENTLVTWIESSNLSFSNDMIKQSAINLIMAMAKVLKFSKVKQTAQFEIMYLFK